MKAIIFVGMLLCFLTSTALASDCDDAVQFLKSSSPDTAYYEGLRHQLEGNTSKAKLIFTVLFESCQDSSVGIKAGEKLLEIGDGVEPASPKIHEKPVPAHPANSMNGAPYVSDTSFRNYQEKGYIVYRNSEWHAETDRIRKSMKTRNMVGGIGLFFGQLFGWGFVIAGLVDDSSDAGMFLGIGTGLLVVGTPMMIAGYASGARAKRHIRRIDNLVYRANRNEISRSFDPYMKRSYFSMAPYVGHKEAGVAFTF